MIEIKFKKLTDNATAPTKEDGDFGWDLFSAEDYLLKPGERHLFKTDISIELPNLYHAVIKPRSGMAVKYGIDVLAGLIDNSYRGNLGICLINFGSEEVNIEKGNKIAQMIIVNEPQTTITEVKELSETNRGSKGFGSSGK